jgi:hypothetical protein
VTSNTVLGADVHVTRNRSYGAGDVNGPATGNGGNFNSAGDKTSHLNDSPSQGNGDVNGPAAGNGQ